MQKLSRYALGRCAQYVRHVVPTAHLQRTTKQPAGQAKLAEWAPDHVLERCRVQNCTIRPALSWLLTVRGGPESCSLLVYTHHVRMYYPPGAVKWLPLNSNIKAGILKWMQGCEGMGRWRS